jgi:type VI secretion system protein ImpK
MREAEDLGEPASLVKLIKYYLELFEKNCRLIGQGEREIEDAKYALIALLDETVLSIAGPCRDHWIGSPLQLEYFGTNVAGEEFYRRLDKLLLEAESMNEVLEVYYLCLSLGFEGKYKIANRREREAVVENLGKTLGKSLPLQSEKLSPHGIRHTSTAFKKRSGIAPLAIMASAAAATVLFVWIALAFLSSSGADNMLDSLP